MTGTAQGVRFVIAGVLFFLIGLPIVFEYFKMNSLGDLYLLSIIWTPAGVCLWWGLVILLRPHVYGEDSRYDVPCESYSKEACLNEVIPLSYTELANKCVSQFLFGTVIVFLFLTGTSVFKSLFAFCLRIVVFSIFMIMVLLFSFMDKINDRLQSLDFRDPFSGYGEFILCTYLFTIISFIISLSMGYILS
ncbi:hypothetical protein [Methanosphaera sp.]